MKRVWIVFVGIICIISLLSSGHITFAKDAQFETYPQHLTDGIVSSAPGFSLGYTRTFGTSGRPYIKDFAHLNLPFGLAVSGNDVWIAERNGNRVLRFSNNGTYLGPEIGDG